MQSYIPEIFDETFGLAMHVLVRVKVLHVPNMADVLCREVQDRTSRGEHQSCGGEYQALLSGCCTR